MIVLGRKIQMGIPFGDSPLISLVRRNHFRWDSCWNLPAGASELITFGARFGSLLLFVIPRDSFSGIPPCFTSLGFTLIVSFARNSVFPRRGFTVLLLSWGTPCLCFAKERFRTKALHPTSLQPSSLMRHMPPYESWCPLWRHDTVIQQWPSLPIRVTVQYQYLQLHHSSPLIHWQAPTGRCFPLHIMTAQ